MMTKNDESDVKALGEWEANYLDMARNVVL